MYTFIKNSFKSFVEENESALTVNGRICAYAAMVAFVKYMHPFGGCEGFTFGQAEELCIEVENLLDEKASDEYWEDRASEAEMQEACDDAYFGMWTY